MSFDHNPQAPSFGQEQLQGDLAITGPGKIGYILAGIVAMLGIAGAIYFGINIFDSNSEIENATVIVPGSQTMTLNEAGEYTIYHVTRGGEVNDSKKLPSNLFDLTITVVRKDTQKEISVKDPSSHSTMTVNNVHKVSYKAFTVSEPCTVVVTGYYSQPSASNARAELFVGRGIFGSICGMFGSLFLGLALTVIIILVTARRHRKARKKAFLTHPAVPPLVPDSGEIQS